MKNLEIVLRQLGELYEFYRQIRTFKIKREKPLPKKPSRKWQALALVRANR